MRRVRTNTQRSAAEQMLIQLDREEARTLKGFMHLVWHLVEPARELVWNWHLDAICEHLEAVTHGDITRLVINVPPGTGKSLSTSVIWPAWVWTFKPSHKWIFASYSGHLSKRDGLRMRRLVESDWYQARWGDKFARSTDEWGALRFVNSAGGFRLSTSPGGGVTGEHADVQCVDDPLKPQEITGSAAVSKTALRSVSEWWSGTMSSRLIDVQTSARVIVMQRLHQIDLAGEVLAESKSYTHLRLPMVYEGKGQCPSCKGRKCHTDTAKIDPRRRKGELLFPARFPRDAIHKRKQEMGSRSWAAQDQQRPSPAEGNIFKREWIRYYKVLPPKLRFVQSWDMAFKKTDQTDPVCGQCWGWGDGYFYLVDQVWGRMSFTETCNAVVSFSAKHPKAIRKFIEAKANGDAVEDQLKTKVSGIVMVNPKGGKEARANAVEPIWESGHVLLPHPSIAPWVHDYVEELVNFPAAPHDDRVDASTQALAEIMPRGGMQSWLKAMEKVKPGSLLG